MCIPRGKTVVLVTKKCSTHDIHFNFWPYFEKLQMLYYNYLSKVYTSWGGVISPVRTAQFYFYLIYLSPLFLIYHEIRWLDGNIFKVDWKKGTENTMRNSAYYQMKCEWLWSTSYLWRLDYCGRWHKYLWFPNESLDTLQTMYIYLPWVVSNFRERTCRGLWIMNLMMIQKITSDSKD